jgi:hypothetical protein
MKWMAEAAQIMRDNPHLNDPTLSFEDKMQLIFPDDFDKRTILADKFGEAGVSPGQLMTALGSNIALLTTIAAISPKSLDNMLTRAGYDPNDAQALARMAVDLTTPAINGIKALAREAAASSAWVSTDALTTVLTGLQVEGAYPRLYQEVALEVIMKLQNENTDKRGVLDIVKFNAAIKDALANPERLRRRVKAGLGQVDPVEPQPPPPPPARSGIDWTGAQ